MTTATLSLAILLRRLRQAQGWTQNELAEQAGVSMRTVSDIERGISRYPHHDTLALLAQALRLAPTDREQLLAIARGTEQSSPDAPVASARLPLPTTSFIGREANLATAEQLLQSSTRLLTVLGPAGIGKTRLAIALGSRLVPHFPDGVYFVELAQVTAAAQIGREIARTLEVREEREVALQQALDARLAGKAILLILDNCEQIAGAVAPIRQLLAAHDRLRIVVTTRVPLTLAEERIMALQGLAYPASAHQFAPEAADQYPAIALFLARAQTSQPAFALTRATAPFVAKICVTLQGVPLAIELAAAQVRTLAVPDIARQLTQRHTTNFLAWIAPQSASIPKRQQTLADAITWSYRLLDAPAQILLRRLCVFAGSFDIEAITAICAAHLPPETDVIDLVLQLIDHQLVQAAADRPTTRSPRFSMQDAIRAYGWHLLEQRQELAPLQRQHATYYAALFADLEAGFVGADQAVALARYSDEYENAIAAMRWATAHQEVLLGLQLVAPLWWYWDKRRTLSEGREWLETMLALYHERVVVPPRLLSRALYGVAILTTTQGDLAQAQQYAQMCLTACERSREPELIAQAQTLLGTIAKMSGDLTAAIGYLQASVQTLRRVGLARQLAPVLNNLGTILIERGQLAEATAVLEEALALKQALGDQRGVAVTLINLGEILKQQAAYERALTAARQAWEAFAGLDDQFGMAMALNNQGEIYLAQVQPELALERFQASLALFQQSDNRPGSALVWRMLGDTHDLLGQTAAALHAWQASLDLSAKGTHADHCRARLAALQ